MLDVAMLVIVVVCFVLAGCFASLCNNLIRPPDRAPDKKATS
jgi:hypothetical protein